MILPFGHKVKCMPYRKWKRVEEKYGAPMGVVLEHLYEKYGSTKAVAAELDVTPKAVIEWRNALECEAETVVRLRCKPATLATTPPPERAER